MDASALAWQCEGPEPSPCPERRMAGAVLVAEADAELRNRLAKRIGELGCHVLVAEDGQAALDTLASRNVDAVLLGLGLPRVSGLNVLGALPALGTDSEFVVLAGEDELRAAAEALRLGARDLVQKPVADDELVRTLCRALRERWLRRDLAERVAEARGTGSFAMVGRTPAMGRVFRLIERVAPTKANVLITGETGTGKELVARAVHDLSPRADEAFVAVNCSAIPGTLLEAELFGHTRGSFTGAVQSRKGLIEEAAGGTLFLDEIGTLSLDVQVKLLRVLEDRRVQRVGSNAKVMVDFRLVTASNTDLGGLAEAGDFREDLLYRLDVFPISVPPLRERRDDIVALADHFLARFSEEHGVEPPRIGPSTLSSMMAYDWPGNVRELENFIERSVIMFPGAESFPFDLPRRSASSVGSDLLSRATEEAWTLDRLEREYLLSTLEHNRWRQSAAAEILGINRRTIHRKLKRYREEGLLPGLTDDG